MGPNTKQEILWNFVKLKMPLKNEVENVGAEIFSINFFHGYILMVGIWKRFEYIQGRP